MAHISKPQNKLDLKTIGIYPRNNISQPPIRNAKRKYDGNADGSNIPAKTMHLSNPTAPKNALCILHEMYRGLDFKIINQEGPVHAPTFTASVQINGIIFEGKGKNKKNAKHQAAEAALRSMIQFKNPSVEGLNACNTDDITDFTSDVLCKELDNFEAVKAEGNSFIVQNGDRNKNGIKEVKVGCFKPQIVEKNPVMLLNELHPQAKYEIVSDNGEQSCKYTVAVIINGQRFEEKGSSKKLSKAAAARSALLSFHNVSIPARPVAEPGKPFLIDSRGEGVPQVFSDHISRLVKEKYISVMSESPTHIRLKVLAGFVMSEGYDLGTCKVISVATGTKCINGERMSVNGTVLNDSHAEIIARRCLCNFFYSELEKLTLDKNKENSIFDWQDNGCRLKKKYKFHLYINSAPCGDSRIFSPFDEYHMDKHPNRKARGQLRTKIECGEGTIPVKSSDLIQTWDGVLQGERLLTMSCSDKIARWNVVGLQGALLSNFIEPIYLDSIILGSLFHPQHLRRAVYGRIEHTVEALPPPYRLNEPKLATILNSEARQIGKAPNFSINWTIGDTHPEIVNAICGRTEGNKISRVSKCRLFYRFLNLAGKIPFINGMTLPQGPLSYSHCKQASSNFQLSKRLLFSAFSKAKLGEWVKKPLEVDQFEWDLESLRELLMQNSLNGSSS